MKTIGLILLVSLLVVVPAAAAVNNISLTAAGNSNVSGSATAISGSFGGVTPHTHLEVNVMMSRLPDANMIYEAWLIDNQSNMKQSLGVLDGRTLNANITLAGFQANDPWDAVAISMEPLNDVNPAPTTIVSLGNLPGSAVSAADFNTAAVLPTDEPFQRQMLLQRFSNLTSDQYTDLRMRGLRVRDIAVAANIAQQCNQTVAQAADLYMREGAELSRVASACNVSVASLLTPGPFQAVAGTIQEARPGMVTRPTFFRTYANGGAVLTYDQWRGYERRGFDWVDVAIAANISAMTGENMDDLLRMVRVQGQLWRDIAMERGLDPDDVMNVSAWPWERGTAVPSGVIDTGETVMTMPGTSGAGTTTTPPSSTY